MSFQGVLCEVSSYFRLNVFLQKPLLRKGAVSEKSEKAATIAPMLAQTRVHLILRPKSRLTNEPGPPDHPYCILEAWLGIGYLLLVKWSHQSIGDAAGGDIRGHGPDAKLPRARYITSLITLQSDLHQVAIHSQFETTA